MHVIHFVLNICCNSNIKFKLYSNYIKIVYIIIVLISMYIINWNHESEIYINDTQTTYYIF